ncbi:venom carboxylesterase-6-like [Culicoides brevitarsis]|uniref:venom carboxylesterase-6-like n=1 Tax=Culicoides brevitarsis TaxID=469753 RepID=UPI00307C0C39
MNYELFLVLICRISLINGQFPITTNIKTPNGELKGVARDHFLAFEGIPYAEPPVGDLRFEPPVPFRSNWDGIRDASKVGNPCLQWCHSLVDEADKTYGDEDCLYMNIYVPQNLTEKVPVILHIPGGGFMFGQGDTYGPEYITTRPLIFVNFNYRVGPLGFLSSSDALIPGNMGMKDQAVVLKYVKENIALFGGDPEKITLTGYSAGSVSVHLHLLSEMSTGLFQNAISHSGTALDCWVMQHNTEEKFDFVVQRTGCQNEDRQKIVDCLKKVPGSDIVRLVEELQPFLFNPFNVFGLVPETTAQNGTPFITDYPRNLIKAGKIQKVPWILSETKDDGLYPVAQFIRKPEYLPFIDKNWDFVSPNLLHYNRTIPDDKMNEVSDLIRKHYIGDDPIDEKSYQKLVDISTDRNYHIGADETVKIQGKYMPMYMYYFTFKYSYGIAELFAGKRSPLLGVGHGDDALLVVYVPPTKHEMTQDELKMQGMLLDMYENFAYNGEPKLGDFTLIRSESADFLKYTEIAGPDDISIKSNDNFGDNQFWKTIKFDEP